MVINLYMQVSESDIVAIYYDESTSCGSNLVEKPLQLSTLIVASFVSLTVILMRYSIDVS